MSRLSKVLKISLLFVLAVVVLLFSASLVMQDKVADIVLQSLNNNVSTKITTGSFRFSLLRQFPNASVELKNVIVRSSPDLKISDFPGISTDTLLNARSASVEIRLWNLLRKDYSIARINIRSGRLNLYTDSAGSDNYNIAETKEVPGEKPFAIDLSRVNLSDVRFLYLDKKAGLTIRGTIDNGRLKGNISGKNILLNASSGLTIDLFRLDGFTISQVIPAVLDVELHKNDYRLFFRKTRLGIENWEILMEGSVFHDNDLDMIVSGKNIDISQITNYFPDKYKAMVSEYNPSGTLKLESTIKGYSTSASNPHVEITFSLNKAHISHEKSRKRIGNFSFDGFYTNGPSNNRRTSIFYIRDFAARLGSGSYKGFFTLSDFLKPVAELSFAGTLYPSELKEFLNLRQIESAEGTVDLDIRLTGSMEKRVKYSLSELLEMHQKSKISFNSFGIEFNDRHLDLKRVNGTVLISESTATDNLELVINNQHIKFSGAFRNFPEWLAGKPVMLTGSGNLTAPYLDPRQFMNIRPGSGAMAADKTIPVFTQDLYLDIDFSIDTLEYKKFSAYKVKGNLNYLPSVLNFKALSLNSQEGIIYGNCLVLQNRNRSIIGKGSFTLKDININTAFNTFDNFGQTFIKSENLAGSLSGSVSVLLPADSLLKPDLKALTVEGKYLITKGALINFEPVKELSSFIQLSELENISFNELENDFFIRSNFLYIPQMDVRSSAVNLSVNGRHGFDNHYEYHVKMLLSQILSSKARKNRSISSEFGEVEDDGLGRTSVFLKIEGAGEDVKVSYDMKAAGNQIRNDIKRERQVLRDIMDEEYRYKSTGTQDSRQSSRPRFRVTWEGSDTLTVEQDPVQKKKESIIKNLFKKKL